MNQQNMNTFAASKQSASTPNDQPNLNWKADIKAEERTRFISQLGKALKLLSPDTSDNTIFSVAKAYELNAFNKSVNKSQYIFAYWKKLQQIKFQQQSHSGTTSLMTNDSQLSSNPNQMTRHQVSSMQKLPSQVQQFQDSSSLINQHQNMNSQIQTETNFFTNTIQTGTLQSQNLQTNPSQQTQFLGLQNVVSEAMTAPTTPGVTDGSNTSSTNMMGNAGAQQQTTATMLPQTNMTHPNTNVTMTPGELRMFLSHQTTMQKNYQNLQQGVIPQFNNPNADPYTLMNLNIPNNVTQNFPPPASSANFNNTTMQVNTFQSSSQDSMGQQYMDSELLMQHLQQQPPTQAQNSSQQQAQQQAQKRAQEKALKMAQAEKNKAIAEQKTLADQKAWAQQQTLNQTQMQQQIHPQTPSQVYSQTQIHSRAQQQTKIQQQGYNQTQTQQQIQDKPQQQVFAQTHTQTQNQIHAQTQQQIHTQTQQQTHAQTQKPSQGLAPMQTQQQRVQVQSFAPTLQQRTQAAEYIRQLEESIRKSRVASSSIDGLPEVEKMTIYNGTLLVKPMYDKLDRLLPVFYALTSNVEATKKLLFMKHMFEDQLNALERNEFVITTEQLIKLKEQFIRYYNWVRNAVIPSNQMASQQPMTSQNPSFVQQSSQHQEADQGQAKTSPVQQSQPGPNSFLMPTSEKTGTKRSGIELQATTNKKQKATPNHVTIGLTQNPAQYQNNSPGPHNQTTASPLPPSGSIGIKRGNIDLQLPTNKKQKANLTPKQTMVQIPPQQFTPSVDTATNIQRQAQAQLSHQAAITYGLPLEIVNLLPPRALQCCWILQQEAQNLMSLTPTQQQYIHEQLNNWVAEARLQINQVQEQKRKQAEIKAQEQRQAEDQRLAQEQKEADEKRRSEEERRTKEEKKAQELKQAQTTVKKVLKTPTMAPKPQFPTKKHTTIQQRSQKPPIYPQSFEEQPARTMTPTPPTPQTNQLPAPLAQMTPPPQIQASRPIFTQLTPPQIQASQLPIQKIPSPRLTPGTALKMSVMNDQYQSPLLYQNDIQEEIALLFSQSTQTKKANKNQVVLQPDGPHNALLFEPFPIDDSDCSDEKKTISEDRIVDTWYEVGMETGVPEMYDIFGGFAFDELIHQDFVST